MTKRFVLLSVSDQTELFVSLVSVELMNRLDSQTVSSCGEVSGNSGLPAQVCFTADSCTHEGFSASVNVYLGSSSVC